MTKNFRKFLIGLGIFLALVIGYLFWPTSNPDSNTSPLTSDAIKEFNEDSNPTKCDRTEPYAIDPALTENIDQFMDTANDHIRNDLGITNEKLEDADKEELISLTKQIIKDPLGHVLWSYYAIQNCVELKYAANLSNSASVTLDTLNAPERVTIEVTDRYKDDPTLTNLLLANQLSQAVSWFQVEPSQRKMMEQCFTDKARGLALQLGYLVTRLEHENDLGNRILGASKATTEFDQLNQAFIFLLATDPPNFNMNEYRDLADPYVRQTDYFKNQCPITSNA